MSSMVAPGMPCPATTVSPLGSTRTMSKVGTTNFAAGWPAASGVGVAAAAGTSPGVLAACNCGLGVSAGVGAGAVATSVLTGSVGFAGSATGWVAVVVTGAAGAVLLASVTTAAGCGCGAGGC